MYTTEILISSTLGPLKRKTTITTTTNSSYHKKPNTHTQARAHTTITLSAVTARFGMKQPSLKRPSVNATLVCRKRTLYSDSMVLTANNHTEPRRDQEAGGGAVLCNVYGE